MNSEISILKSLYNITKDGEVIRLSDMKTLKSSFDYKGYKRIRLKIPIYCTNVDGRKTYKVHRLVAMYHLDNYNDNLQVNHKNGIKHDNRVENLEMVTQSENSYHAWNNLDSKNRKLLLISRKDVNSGRFIKKI